MAVTADEQAHANAAINRLRSHGRSHGHFQRVSKQAALEDSNLTVEVHVHDAGALGDGRTIIIEKQEGDIIYRKMHGDGTFGMNADWFEIDLTTI